MTLHVAVISASYVLVVGDRLLTVGDTSRRDPWDPAANKALYIETERGMVAVSYAGLAHIDGVPTDEWLLSELASSESMGTSRDWVARVGGPLKLTVGGLLDRVATAIERRLPAQRAATSEKRLEVLIAGWTWRADVGRSSARPRTYFRMLQHDGQHGTKCRLESARRMEYKRTSTADDVFVASIGGGSQALIDNVCGWIAGRNTSLADVEDHVAGLIRVEAARPSASIGPDLMSMWLDPTSNTKIRYLRSDTSGSPNQLMYTPGVISRTGIVQRPALHKGSHLGGYRIVTVDKDESELFAIEFAVEPPFPSRSGRSSIQAQPRRLFP